MSKEVIIAGSTFRVLINGRKSINGKPYGVELTGEITEQDAGETIYDAAVAAIGHVRTEMPEMELPSGIQISIITPTEREFEAKRKGKA
ncbi:hypothetical protein JIN84_12840 [Luteolibacter yonseiensis]|uniref:Uncharacterized protein n=1 Tax=Luteolibacter yonseiensis TaxID=1144680 RepID=A0A934R787_9BACT|nr:hypothetical protein [Luteolibacter yonseiensis]MBK1816505.1 hypothetical protein [Luteolibacter yonseiensis]